MKSCSASSSKVDRKTIERNRRMQMKGLCFKLASLIPRHYNLTKELSTQQDRLEHAASYIKELQQRVEELKRREEEAKNIHGTNNDMRDTITIGSNLPVLELRDMGQNLQEVTLITGLNNNFMFYEVISILSEEGAEVVNASFSVVGDKVFHTIHSQLESRSGLFKIMSETKGVGSIALLLQKNSLTSYYNINPKQGGAENHLDLNELSEDVDSGRSNAASGYL